MPKRHGHSATLSCEIEGTIAGCIIDSLRFVRDRAERERVLARMQELHKIHVYIAGPISSDPLVGARNAILEASFLAGAGLVPYVPHLSVLWQMVDPHSYEFWMDQCFAWLARCDCLFRLPGESRGADREVAMARKLGLPVFDQRRELFDYWARPQTPEY